jgi:hypothetical protein
MRDVRSRDQDALVPGQTAAMADVVESLDLLVHTTDRLDLAALVDRSGHRQDLLIGIPDSADSSAQNSATEALSPSTIP